MTVMILVHGGMHGGWCWEKVEPILREAGLRTYAPDLPGMGRDRTPLRDVTLDMWTSFIMSAAKAAGEPVILVGHSRGGIVISEAAERAPELVQGLIYLTAHLLPNGASLKENLRDRGEALGQALTYDPERISFQVERSAARERFYHHCSDDESARALDRLCPEPTAPLRSCLTVTDARWGSVPRAYIECVDDRTIPLASQRDMQRLLPCNPVRTIDSDHSPFFSKPAVLAGYLVEIAEIWSDRLCV